MTIQPETFAAAVSSLIYAGGAWAAFKIDLMGWKDSTAKFLILVGLIAGAAVSSLAALGLIDLTMKGG